jgi:hypothetical protein
MHPDKKLTAFVIMPFEAGFDPVYQLFIREALSLAGLEVVRADDIRSQRNILSDVVEWIAKSELIVADLTGENPNVFYELGIAHALAKPVLLLTQSIEDVPFDLRSYRLLPYSTHFSEIATAKKTLEEYGRNFVTGTLRFGSPVSDFLEKSPIPLSVRPSVSLLEDLPQTTDLDDRGLVDHMEELNEGYERLTVIINDVSAHTEQIGDAASATGSELTAAAERPSDGMISHVRKISRRLAEKLNAYAQSLSQANEEYRTIAQATDDNLQFVIDFQREASVEDKPFLVMQLTQYRKVLASSQRGRESFLNLSKTMGSMPRLERQLKRALDQASLEVHQMAESIALTTASVERAIDALQRILDNIDGEACSGAA